jgi:hypothetical protein
MLILEHWRVQMWGKVSGGIQIKLKGWIRIRIIGVNGRIRIRIGIKLKSRIRIRLNCFENGPDPSPLNTRFFLQHRTI